MSVTDTAPFRDPALPLDERTADLLGRLTLREKIGQLNQRLLGWRTWRREGVGVGLTPELDDEVAQWGGLGALYGTLRADAWSGRDWSNGADPMLSAEIVAAVQERVTTASRWGIPALLVEEAPHGHQALGSQLFPVNLAVAATWEPALLEEASAHIGAELRARGVHLALVSGLDMLRDPRWGRAEETFGEDPLLAAHLTRALVRGLQSQQGIGAVLKHFAGQGAGIGGRNSSSAPLGHRELREIHLPAARAGVAEGALAVMAAYNDIDGVPCVAAKHLLTDLLRGEWGFQGVVMADMFAVDRLQRSTIDAAEAGAVALRAGVDLSLCDVSFAALEIAVERGIVSEAEVDAACARVLRLKIRLGLLDPPRPLPSFPPAAAGLAGRMAASSLVLLRDGGALPLAAGARVAVVGPNGDDPDALLGDYVPPTAPGSVASVRAALETTLGHPVPFERGCDLTDRIHGGIARATALAAVSDVVVLVLGSSSARSYDDAFQDNGAAALGRGRPHATTGEGFDVAEVELPQAQRDLLEAVAATGVRTVAVVVSGRPLGIERVANVCDTVVYAWYPGPEGGTAIAAALAGEHAWRGRLPVSLPRSSGTLPVAYNERVETTLRYVDGEAAPVHRFGAGTVADVAIDATRATPTADPANLAGLAVSAVARNRGADEADEVVQLYARPLLPGLLPRRAILAGYSRTRLGAGEERLVTVSIDADAIDALGIDDVTEGRLEVWLSTAGAGAPDDVATIELRPQRRSTSTAASVEDGERSWMPPGSARVSTGALKTPVSGANQRMP